MRLNQLRLSRKKEFLLGSADSSAPVQPDLDLTLYGGLDKGVSRIHAALHGDADALTVTDLDSANGTFLNGTRLAAHEPQLVYDGDEIRLGLLAMNVFFG